mmetsp:Transcript_75846/g.162702  ORF Transcript_75846/g.162702 Transcript_75846/m.162702 type:complete len:477 (-) Transcript_75846:398-1828(-)
MHQVTKRDSRLHLPGEPDEDGFGHVQRHDACGSSEGHKPRTRWEGDANWEPRVRITARADSVGEQHAVEPRVDDAVAGPESNTTAVTDEVGKGVVGHDIHRLRVRRCVAEGLHHKVRREAEAGEVLELIPSHGAGGILAAHGGHLRLAISAGQDASHSASLAHHFLRQGEALGVARRSRGRPEEVGRRHAQALACLAGETTADDQRDATPGLDLVEENLGLQRERGKDRVGAVRLDHALIGEDVDQVTHLEVCHVHLDWQSACILHGVEENWGDLPTDADRPSALVGHCRDVLAHVPKHRIRRRLPGGARAHDVANVAQRQAFLLELRYQRLAVVNALAGNLQHRQRMERDVRARPCIRRRREIISVRLTYHLEDADRDLLRNLWAACKPLRIGPSLHHLLRMRVPGLHLLLNVVEGIEDEEGAGQCSRSLRSQGRVVERGDEGGDVVPALHRAKDVDGIFLRDQGRGGLSLGQGR